MHPETHDVSRPIERIQIVTPHAKQIIGNELGRKLATAGRRKGPKGNVSADEHRDRKLLSDDLENRFDPPRETLEADGRLFLVKGEPILKKSDPRDGTVLGGRRFEPSSPGNPNEIVVPRPSGSRSETRSRAD